MTNEEKKRPKKPKGTLTRASDYISWIYLQYCLITGLYMLEPWERAIFNTVVIALLSVLTFVFYVFVLLPFSSTSTV